MYKENSTTSLEEGVLRSQMICMIGVPAKHKTRDLLQVCNSAYYSHDNFTEKIYQNTILLILQFTAPCHSELEMMRFIQYQDVPNQYMVLLRFRCQEAADEFYQAFNGALYNNIEPEVCSLIYISKVETCKESEYYPLSNHTELPVCSICLERKCVVNLTVVLNELKTRKKSSFWQDKNVLFARKAIINVF